MISAEFRLKVSVLPVARRVIEVLPHLLVVAAAAAPAPVGDDGDATALLRGVAPRPHTLLPQ